MKIKFTQFRCLVTTFLLVAAMVMPSTAQAQTITPVQPGGEGTASIPYLISTAEELYWFAGLVNGDASVCINGISQNRNAWAVLESDITVNSGVLKADGTLADDVSSFAQWTPIGNSNYPYTGNFDGQGHTISGLYFNNNTGSLNVGLFGYIDKSYDANTSCTIQNVGIVDSYFNGFSCVGSVCGCSYLGTISNCYNTGTVIATDYHSGGICGLSNYSSIEKCYNTGSVEGYTIVGGVAGQCMYGSITNCYNTGSVKGVGTASAGVGGVCETAVGSEVTNCYNIGTLSGQTVGNVINSSCKTLTNSYYLADGETDEREGTTAMSADQFANGEVAYLLNGNVASSENVWRQNIGGETSDTYPVLNNTHGVVYAGYQHEGTTPLCSNSSSYAEENNLHAHAYDANATTEAGGNHDMSCVQNEQNPYTWKDTENNTNATAKCNFTCTVCNSELAKDMTVTSDKDKTNVPVTCSEDGTNYYKATLTLNGNSYDASYEQNVPKLGHDMTEEVSLNSEKHIYQKVCKRDGCGYADYYATSDESVVAKLEDGIYKVASFDLADATAYNSEAEFTVTSLAYKRTFYDDKWMAVYVPFAIDCSKLDADYEMATINNFHEYEQEDGTYNVVLEVKRVTKGGTIPALTPCLMRMKTDPAAEVEKTLTFENAAFSAAADKSIDCSSVTRYYQFTGSLSGKTGLTAATDFVLNAGKLYKTSESTVLLPQRWYLSATDRTSTPVEPATMLRSISINVIGDGEATGIEDIHVNTESGADASGSTGIYDLQGRKINSEPTKGMYIKNGKKYIK